MKNKGFSLVELIVVIAIMAILVGVAVPVYTGYIGKAQQSKDIQMIDEIKHAMQIASASSSFDVGESGYMILTSEGIEGVAEGSALETVLKNTFGDDFRTTLKLSYDGWGNNGLTAGLTAEMAYSVKVSSYMAGNRADDLLSDVETMTGMASNLVGSMLGDTSLDGLTFSELFKNSAGVSALDTTAAKYGISKGEYATWEDWAAAGNETAFSNLLVLAAAEESEQFVTTMDAPEGQYEMSSASTMILQFSSYYAFAATDKEFSAYLDAHLAKLDNGEVTSPQQGATWYHELKNKAIEEGYDVYTAEPDENSSSQAVIDQGAFLTIMSGLGNPTTEQADKVKNDINNTNLFTQGVVNDMYTSYLDVVDSMAGMYDPEGSESVSVTLAEGQVAILFAQQNGSIAITDTLPTE